MNTVSSKPRVACLVDGEHYLPNIKASLRTLDKKYRIDYLIFIGGTEKIGKLEDVKKALPYPIHFAEKNHLPDSVKIGKILDQNPVPMVLDLSDEPIMNYLTRFQVGSQILYHGSIYRGADFEFQPLQLKKVLTKPSLAIWGTGKRIGKTALGGLCGRILKKAGLKPAIVTLSRGGPDKPLVVRGDRFHIDLPYLLKIDAEGLHASSDCFEDALTAQVATFGCRRCGGGMSGRAMISLLKQGAQMANKASYIKSIILEGSGATVPEVQSDKVILVMDASQDINILDGYLTPLRLLYADLVILNMCEDFLVSPGKIKKIIANIRQINPRARIATTVLRPYPLSDITNKKIFLATTASPRVNKFLKQYLEKNYRCQIVAESSNLANRPALVKELRSLSGANLLLTELKAAAIVVAAKEARKAGLETVFMDYRILRADRGGDVTNLEKEIIKLLPK